MLLVRVPSKFTTVCGLYSTMFSRTLDKVNRCAISKWREYQSTPFFSAIVVTLIKPARSCVKNEALKLF